MRSDKQKLTSPKNEAAKNQQKVVANGRQPQAPTKQGQAKKAAAHEKVRSQDEHTGHTLH